MTAVIRDQPFSQLQQKLLEQKPINERGDFFFMFVDGASHFNYCK